jgi:alcohol dehydrogenase YqhD (iron-dependent ADH family)
MMYGGYDRPQQSRSTRAEEAATGEAIRSDELSGRYDMTHGAGLAIVIPAWMKYVSRNTRRNSSSTPVRVWA